MVRSVPGTTRTLHYIPTTLLEVEFILQIRKQTQRNDLREDAEVMRGTGRRLPNPEACHLCCTKELTEPRQALQESFLRGENNNVDVGGEGEGDNCSS